MTRIRGKQVRRSLGTYPIMTLAEARAAAKVFLADAVMGVDPKEKVLQVQREAEVRSRNTVAGAADSFIREHVDRLRSAYAYRRQIEVEIQVCPIWGA